MLCRRITTALKHVKHAADDDNVAGFVPLQPNAAVHSVVAV